MILNNFGVHRALRILQPLSDSASIQPWNQDRPKAYPSDGPYEADHRPTMATTRAMRIDTLYAIALK